MHTFWVYTTDVTGGVRSRTSQVSPSHITCSSHGAQRRSCHRGNIFLRGFLLLVTCLLAVAPVSLTASMHPGLSPYPSSPLPPATPAAPWQTLNESLLPYPIFYPATAVLNNSIVLLGGCITADCATPVGRSGKAIAATTPRESTASALSSPYHEHVVALNVEMGAISTLSPLTLPGGLGFAGRYAAVTLTDSIYVVRSCTMSTHSPEDIWDMGTEELQALQVAYAPVVAFYPSGTAPPATHTDDTPEQPAVNLNFFEVPANRVRVNASCTALATENKVLIIGGFLLSEQRATNSVDSFDVVTRKYDADVAALSRPVLQPSVTTSTGFAAVVGGWTYERDTTGEAPQEGSRIDKNRVDGANLQSAHEIIRRTHSAHPPRPSFVSLRPVVPYVFDLLFFEPNNFAGGARASPLDALRAGASICVSPVDASALPRTVVEDVILSAKGCHVAVFGGQVVLTDHNLNHMAVLDVRATSERERASVAVKLTRTWKAKGNAAASADVNTGGEALRKSTAGDQAVKAGRSGTTDHHRHATSASGDTWTTSTDDALPDPSPSPSPTPTPPTYRYTWMQPTLIPVPHARPQDDSVYAETNVSTDTILLYYAIGGVDCWTQTVAQSIATAAHSASDSRLGIRGSRRVVLRNPDEVIRQVPSLRWAQRQLPDTSYDSDNPDVLAVKIPTPVWPDDLSLQTTTEGTIHLVFPNIDYTRYCTWEADLLSRDENVVCAVRLSSRRDCVGNTAGTLDSAYNGAPNTTVLFSASGSTTPVYVCFGYMVQPTSWPMCRTQRSFSILNPMMPLRILDNSPTSSPSPSPSPTRDPADRTTSSPLFMLTVGVAVVTLLVAVLLVARLDHVPDDGLLVNLLDHGAGAGAQQASPMTSGNGGAQHNGQRRRKLLFFGSFGSGDGNGSGVGEGMYSSCNPGEGDGKKGMHRMSTYAQFLEVLDRAREHREEYMLATAANVLRLHQHRYSVLSRVGQGEHSLCFLALRKAPPPPPQQQQHQQQQRAAQHLRLRDAAAGFGGGVWTLGESASAIMRLSSLAHPTPFFPAARHRMSPAALNTATAPPSVTAKSSLWTARHDQNTAVVIKYTQCPDDATRAVITRLCERLRDLHADAVTAALGAAGVRGPPRSTASSRHTTRRPRVPDTGSVSTDLSLQPPRVPPGGAFDPRHEVVGSSTGSSGDGAATLEVLAADAEDPTSSLLREECANTATFLAMSGTGFPPLPHLSLSKDAARVVDDHHDDDADADAGRCAWLDAHEVNVVLSLFLQLPEDLFVSYEVSVLHHQEKHYSGSRRRHAHEGRLTSPSVSRAAVDWNMRQVWPGLCTARVEAAHLTRDPAMRSGRENPFTQPSPRVCWAACVNPLQPSAANPWSLCLVMPYEHHGDLAEHIARCRQAQLPLAEIAKATHAPHSCCHAHGVSNTATTCSVPITTLHHCWTESLLCSVLFQVCTGLQLLHTQSPPILHGNIKQTNILLREPATFSVARRRVITLGTTVTRAGMGIRGSNGGADPGSDLNWAPVAVARKPEMLQAGEGGACRTEDDVEAGSAAELRAPAGYSSLWRKSSFVAAAAAVIRRTGSPVLQSLTPAVPWLSPNRADDVAPVPTAADSHSAGNKGQPHECETRQREWASRYLLSMQTYLPISLTDAGMSWWLTVQLPQRLRGCFGNTTRSTLRQTPAGRRWLHRLHPSQVSSSRRTTRGGVVPSDECIAALAHFLFDFIEVPPHVAPELLWGRLCTLAQSDPGDYEGNTVADLAASISSTRPPSSSLYLTQSLRGQCARSSRRDGRPRGGDVLRGPTSFPAVSPASMLPGATGDAMAMSAIDDTQPHNAPSENQQAQQPTNACAGDEDMDGDDAALHVEEDSIFTCEEVSALTSAMWKAEGLTRVSHRHRHHEHMNNPPRQQREAPVTAADPPIFLAPSAVTTTAKEASHGGGGDERQLPLDLSLPPIRSDSTSPPAGASLPSSPQGRSPEVYPGFPHPASASTTSRYHTDGVHGQVFGNSISGGRPLAGAGDSRGMGGSHSSSGVYELLIRRVLAMDTASDIWSIGVLLYGMCAAAYPPRESDGSVAADTSRCTVHTCADEASSPATMTCSGSSQLAQRALSALLGDLYDLAAAGVPCGERGSISWTSDGKANLRFLGRDAADGAAVGKFDEADDDQFHWPRSCALEDEIMQAVCDAGYSHSLAATLASMLSPVAARRPSASDIVDQLRLVTEPASATDAPKNIGGSRHGVKSGKSDCSVAQKTHSLHTRPINSASDAPSAVVLDERTARMALRR